MKISFSPGVLLLFPVLLLKGGMLFPAALLAATLHESGHLLMGRWLGIRFSRMEFDLLGARLYPTRLPSYREEFFLVIAGPFFSLLPLLFAPVLLGSAFLKYFFYSSLSFALFNLLPFRGSDGGRALCAALSFFFPPAAVDRISAGTTYLTLLFLFSLSGCMLLRYGQNFLLCLFSAWLFARFFLN